MLEVILALSIAVVVLVVGSTGLRLALAAWSRAEARMAELDQDRSLMILVERSLAGAFPYRTSPAAGEPTILFDGEPDRLSFVTLSPSLGGAATAFTAVSLAYDGRGLALRQQPLPNEPALDRLPPIAVSPAVGAIRFRYRGPEPGAWKETWDTAREEGLPRAVEITLVPGAAGRPSGSRTLIVPIRATGR